MNRFKLPASAAGLVEDFQNQLRAHQRSDIGLQLIVAGLLPILETVFSSRGERRPFTGVAFFHLVLLILVLTSAKQHDTHCIQSTLPLQEQC